MNFQAAVTAIAAIQLARGRPLHWLDGLIEDIPVALSAETGDSGDDVCLEFNNDKTAEVQIKRGLSAGNRLWEPLLALSAAIYSGAIDYGVLAVSSTSSGTIRDRLAQDITRIGDGRDDNLGSLAVTMLEKLAGAGLPAASVCQRLRIVTINALSEDASSIAAARAELVHLCHDEHRVGDAWNRLYRDAGQLIEKRGRRTASTVLRVLQSEGIELAARPQTGPVALLPKLTRWVAATSAQFSILGAGRSLAIDTSWIPLKVVVREDEADDDPGLAEALSRYHNSASRDRRDRHVIDGETVGRFIRHVVVVAGPGMGKSVLQKKLARCYSAEGYPVLRVSLASVAVRMHATGSSFVESLFELGLGGFDIPASDVVKASISDWVLLCDGLDECGADQEHVAQGIHDYVAGHPHCRVVVTTRPVGYRSTLLRTWRHYEIIPLEATAATRHLGDLIADIAPIGSALVDTAWDIASAALKSSTAEKVVARSPLLLGMASVVLARGKTLGRSKAELYARMFELIDQTPTTRDPVPPSTPGVLHRFLDIFGWNVVENPAAQTAELIASCTETFAVELQIPPLKARELAENCISYWQAAGTIERVRHGSQETLTFIHKTFGEFAAARFLVAAREAEQERLVAAVLTRDNCVEVLAFAGSLGIADLIASSFLGNLTENDAGVSLMKRALALTAEADPPPNAALRRRIIEAAFSYVSKDRRYWGYNVGEALIGVAECFPSEVGPFAASHLNGEHAWTRAAAWACAAIAGPTYYALDDLVKQLEATPALAEYGFSPGLSGAIELGGGNIGLLQRFLVSAIEVVLDACPAEIADKILPPVINNKGLQTWSTSHKIRELLKRKGKTYTIDLSVAEMSWTKNLVGSKEYNAAQRLAYQKMLGALLDLAPAADASLDQAAPAPLLYISAFLHLTKFLDSPVHDMWAWGTPYDAAAVHEVFRGIVGIAPIDQTQLLLDARILLRRLDALTDDDIFKVWGSIASVDVPDFDEPKAKELKLKLDLLEAALYHRSSWIVRLAVYLYINAADASKMRVAAARLFVSGKGVTLAAASHLAEQLGAEAATSLACDRLRKPLVAGCDHIFDLLRRLKPAPRGDVFAAIENGLMTGDEDTAVAAAALAEEIAVAGDAQLLRTISRGYDHWAEHEKPYPVGGGVIPRSPREKLLLARFKIEPASVEALFDYAKDTRSDVTKVALDAMMRRLHESAEARSYFVEAVLGARPEPSLLREALNQKVPFVATEVDGLCALLEADEGKMRYAALGLLTGTYLSKDRAEALAKGRLSDKEQDIRERAHKAIEQLSDTKRSIQ